MSPQNLLLAGLAAALLSLAPLGPAAAAPRSPEARGEHAQVAHSRGKAVAAFRRRQAGAPGGRAHKVRYPRHHGAVLVRRKIVVRTVRPVYPVSYTLPVCASTIAGPSLVLPLYNRPSGPCW